jgi:hypothetical protein
MNFNELLILGQEHETEAIIRIEILNNVKLTTRQDETNFKYIHYDFSTSDGLKYEVKADFMSNKTGNLFIEFLDGREKIAGIALSDADFYIIYTHQQYILISIEKLKELTINKPIRRGKDGTKGYIIKWELVRDKGTII